MTAYFLTLIVVLIWASFAAVSKLALQSLDSFQVQFFIMGIACVENLILLIVRNKLKILLSLPNRRILRLAVGAIPAYLYFFFYLFALKRIPAVEASILNYTWPFLVVVFSAFILKEKITSKKMLALIAGFIGVVIALTKGNLQNLELTNFLGDMLALIAAVFWGFFVVLGKKNKEDPNVSYFIYFFVMFIFSSTSLLLFSKPVIPPGNSFWGLLSLGSLNLTLAYFLWFKALRIGKTSQVASLSFFIPFINLIYISLLLDEKIALSQFFGLFIIAVGSYWQNKETVQEKA